LDKPGGRSSGIDLDALRDLAFQKAVAEAAEGAWAKKNGGAKGKRGKGEKGGAARGGKGKK
jgi:hypothetical protein